MNANTSGANQAMRDDARPACECLNHCARFIAEPQPAIAKFTSQTRRCSSVQIKQPRRPVEVDDRNVGPSPKAAKTGPFRPLRRSSRLIGSGRPGVGVDDCAAVSHSTCLLGKLSDIQTPFTLFILFQTWVQPLDDGSKPELRACFV